MAEIKPKRIQHIANFCAYCGSDSKQHKTTFGNPITQDALKKVIRAKEGLSIYFLKMCPACNTIIDCIGGN